MKSQFFLDKYRLPVGLFVLIITCGPITGFWIYGTISMLIQHNFDFFAEDMLVMLAIDGLFALACFLIYLAFSSLAFSVLSIRKDKIIWKCFPFKRVELRASDCLYVGMADVSEQNNAAPLHRGDENSYIYLSTTPLPLEYKHQINRTRHTRCQKGFIKFAYSDKLCLALMEWLPPEKRGNLRAFYNRMQEQDRQLQAQKAAKKRRKEKAKKAKRKEK